MASLLDRLNGSCLQTPDGNETAWNGQGQYIFPSGVKYKGNFREGMFHGAGELHFKNGDRFVGVWKDGKLQSGVYKFEDDLEYKPENWTYCTDADRRFWSEIQQGIRPGDMPILSDKS